MKNTNILVFGSLMACIASLFQILPVFLTEAFILMTVFSAVPIYIITRMSLKVGFLTFVASFLLVSFFSVHEALIFIFTNGSVGLSLGCTSYYTKRKFIIVLISAALLTWSLCILNFFIGIPVFGTDLPGTVSFQMFTILVFSIIYNFLFLKLCNSIFNRLSFFAIKKPE